MVYKLKEVYLGPARDALVEKIGAKLKGRAESKQGDVERLQRRIRELDQQISRLVTGIRTTDAPELAQELAAVKKERDSVAMELRRAKKPAARTAPQGEPEKIAGQLQTKPARLIDADPALLREVVRRFVAKIECRWDSKPGKRRIFYPLLGVGIGLYATGQKLPPRSPPTIAPRTLPADRSPSMLSARRRPPTALRRLLTCSFPRGKDGRGRGAPDRIGPAARRHVAAKMTIIPV